MAANDELPRGTVLYANPGANAQAVVTFPAIPNVSWVLTEVDWQAYASGETIAQNGSVEVLTGGIPQILQLGIFFVAAESGLQVNPGSWQGQYIGGAGNSLQVAFTGGISGGFEFLVAQAYPV